MNGVKPSVYIYPVKLFPKNTVLVPMKELFPFYSIGHFINQPSNPTAFEVLCFEEMEEPDVDDLHKHTFYEILWFDEGESIQTIDYQLYKIQPETFFFISPGQLHRFEEWQPLKGGSILFTEDFFTFNHQNKDALFEFSFLDNVYSTPFLTLDWVAFQEIKVIISLIIKEKKRVDYSPAIIQSFLHILLSQIQRCINAKNLNGSPKRYTVLYKQLKSLIDQHYSEKWTASDYAEKMFVTQHHLNLIAKRVTGKTTSELIRARSILEAKRLLTFSDASVSEIASELSFFDLSYFSKVFKAETKMSPLEFKRAMSEKYRNG